MRSKNIIISFIILLFVLMLCLPNIIDLIPSTGVKYVITVIFSFLVFLFLIYITFNDIRKKEYTTTVYIVLLDIVTIIVFAVLSYVYFNKTDTADINTLIRRDAISIAGSLYLLCESIAQNFLKSARFKGK